MDSWNAHTPSPSLKFENSPTESLLSTPDEMYPSLFGTAPASGPSTLNPLDVMSPKSLVDDHDHDLSLLSMSPAPETPDADGSTSEKKPVKKRKSWGQVLPEPKTNLPPRKRAKTEDEKEQRRVERVLRNRRAAQSSRERKRQEVEALEHRNKQLEELLRKTQQDNATLLAELRKFTSVPGVMAGASTSFDALRPSPVTFSQELFSSQDGHNMSVPTTGTLEQLLTTIPSNNTVNPASISPVLTPVAEEADEDSEPAAVAPLAGASLAAHASPDATQHPAAMLCSDLQCRSAEAAPSWLAAQQPLHPALALLLPLQLLLTSTSTIISHCSRPLMQIAMSLRASFSLPPTPAILNTIILLVTNPSPSRTTSTSTTSSPTTTSHLPTSSNRSTKSTVARSQSRRSSTLRLKFLRKILTCSPALARPLMDATAEALRLVSGQGYEVDRVLNDDASAAAAAGDLAKQLKQVGGGTHWLNGARVPSKEVLITLMWVLRAEERKIQIRQGSPTSKLGSPSVLKTAPTASSDRERFVLKVLPKRSLGGFPETVSLKRRRVD